MRRAIVLMLLACVALSGHSALAGEAAPLSAGAYIRAVGNLKIGDSVPKFRAKDIYGVEVCIEDLIKAGRKPVLAFWSMYCQACIEKFNAMVIVQDRFADRGLTVISVNTDGEYQRGEQSVRDFIAEYEQKHAIQINFPVLYDERNWLPQTLNIEFLPTIISVDASERVAGFYQKFNETEESQIVLGIEELVLDLLRQYSTGGPPAVPGVPPVPAAEKR